MSFESDKPFDLEKIRLEILQGKLADKINEFREQPEKQWVKLELEKVLFETLLESIEKQIPKRVENKKESSFFGYTAYCPSCKMTIVSSFNSNGCGHCRQRLDWEQ